MHSRPNYTMKALLTHQPEFKALFAIPSMANESPSHAVYWAVTIPITGLVIAIWQLWTWLETRRDNRTDSTSATLAQEIIKSTIQEEAPVNSSRMELERFMDLSIVTTGGMQICPRMRHNPK